MERLLESLDSLVSSSVGNFHLQRMLPPNHKIIAPTTPVLPSTFRCSTSAAKHGESFCISASPTAVAFCCRICAAL
eukprot:scaffold11294_cov56-Cyclotella_meneghiniana.AAC.2